MDSRTRRTTLGRRPARNQPANNHADSRRSVAEAPILLTTEEATRLLAISRTKLYGLVYDGEIDTVHIGRAVRYTRSALEDYVARLTARGRN
jgi:excisionase family DNA binding protein